MSTASPFLYKGLFPFAVAELTTVQIAAYNGGAGSGSQYFAKVTGLTLQQAWQNWWMLEKIHAEVSASGLAGPPLYPVAAYAISGSCDFDKLAATNSTPHPACKIPSEGYPPYGGFYRLQSPYPTPSAATADGSFGFVPYGQYSTPYDPKWGPIVKNTDDGSFALFLEIYARVLAPSGSHAGAVNWSTNYMSGACIISTSIFGATVSLGAPALFYPTVTGGSVTLTPSYFTP